ncbi:hypothetical protein TWF106_008042 [Orbilia oligospora]|uniref:Peptidase M43 pregnancy-associated plasma-A domain-containing protein n=1 Tax=Orbilia oligospora TaxID=2813651 RepID=A0A7C8QLN7_ORBOL|nr:hypothetical protein TWF106_008042 [Orbilia oligospora]
MRSFITALPFLALLVDARKCGNEVVPPSVQMAARYFDRQDKLADARTLQAVAERTLVIDTYFHVISSDNTLKGGNLPDEQVTAQFNALNRDFKDTGISFVLKDVTRTVNKEWATFSVDNDSKDVEYTMKKALRQGSYAALNVYYRPLGDGLLGICVFPEDVTQGDRTFVLDGCQVLTGSVPGGDTTNYNDGKTATHEIGHWLGLFHTFQGGCAGGDGVDDTPAQRSPTNGCPTTNPDTCTGPQYPGVDPIHNFMDYSYDICMYEFSLGQTKRVFDFWDRYRAPHIGGPEPTTGKGVSINNDLHLPVQ